MSGPRLGLDGHTQRAKRHLKVAKALDSAGDEWAAVCYFYAAYHLIRGALLSDPIFNELGRCQSKHADLLPEDRFTARHKGRRNTSAGREWGLNELTQILYPHISQSYERLHQASIDVRYGKGLRGTLEPLRLAIAAIEKAAEEQTLCGWSGEA